MSRIHLNHLGVPPLAGICNYEEACIEGYTVDDNVHLLKRYHYVKKKLLDVYAAHLACTAEWEIKCAFSLHLWLEAEHSATLRKRVSEMREPPLGIDKVPDNMLEIVMEEVIRAETTLELLTGIYIVIKPALLRSMHKHIRETNPIADFPTTRLLKHMLMDEEEMVAWGTVAVQALIKTPDDQEMSTNWSNHLSGLLRQAGDIHGDHDLALANQHMQITTRYIGEPYEMDVTPKRDHRFKDNYNRSATYDEYYRDENLQPDERVFALIYKRLREMDVPEWMGPIIYKTKNKPWEYYVDLSRQLWDEARHAMLGEIGMYALGIEFYKYPVDLKSSMILNTLWTPKDAHIILWGIEQSLMNKETGKRKEWLISQNSDIAIGKLIQDYDWADEVLHAQFGRKWLLPEYAHQEELSSYFNTIFPKWKAQSLEETEALSEQKPWWSEFVAEARRNRETRTSQ